MFYSYTRLEDMISALVSAHSGEFERAYGDKMGMNCRECRSTWRVSHEEFV